MFHTSCVLYRLVFPITNISNHFLTHLGDDHTDRRIYIYFFRLPNHMIRTYARIYNELVVMVLELKNLTRVAWLADNDRTALFFEYKVARSMSTRKWRAHCNDYVFTGHCT